MRKSPHVNDDRGDERELPVVRRDAVVDHHVAAEPRVEAVLEVDLAQLAEVRVQGNLVEGGFPRGEGLRRKYVDIFGE